jgi:transcriptional regulator with XRE-family HTH domain
VRDTRSGLGSFLQLWRGRVAPAAVGLPVNGPRRASGLRREELATLAGVSVDYLVRLEQGRAANPSVDVLASLARALQLSVEERDHLYRLAGKEPPGPTQIVPILTPGVRRLLDRFEDSAVAVFDVAWNLVTWNQTWAALMGDPSASTGLDRNLLWRHFTGRPSRVARSEEETAEYERTIVADLQVAAGRYPHDAALRKLIETLCQSSPVFRELWDQKQLAVHRSDRKTIQHPQVGDITVDCDVLAIEGTEARVVLYTTEPATPDSHKLGLVTVIGLQDIPADTSPPRS